MRDVTAESNQRAVMVRVHVAGAALLTPDEAEAFAAELTAAAGEAKRFKEYRSPDRVRRSQAGAAAKRLKAKRLKVERRKATTTQPEG